MVPLAGRATVLWLALWTSTTSAEFSSDDYRSGGATQTDAERAPIGDQMRAEIEAARQREVERALGQERDQAAERERLQAALAAARARLPPGAVLAETHCGTCHAPDVLATARHSWLGWHLTVLRMRYLNGAQIPPRDLGTIVEHLTRTQGASLPQAVLEYGLAALVVLATWALVRRGLRWRRRVDRGGSAGA